MAVAVQEQTTGKLVRISGPMIEADEMLGVGMGEIVRVGKLGLMGEVIRIDGDKVYAQVFESTEGMFLGEPVVATGAPLCVELGPGLLGATFDGIQRPLEDLRQSSGDFIGRGITAVALDREKKWPFAPRVTPGQAVLGGDILGVTQETRVIEHRILVPPRMTGVIAWVAPEGEYTVTDVIARLEDGTELRMMHRSPVKQGRPFAKKLLLDTPFLTGQRVLDCLFPIAMGGSAIVPGGFGTGKTVVEQSISKFCNAQVIVYVGCGERGNEMTEVLSEFPHLEDPNTGESLMSRTILVVNTSNMPVAARDASVYTGMTLAEYYRDQGYDCALMADSTSRWAEALREISSRLEEMPGEEGYPTYLSARIAEFYERTGRVVCCGVLADSETPRIGSLTAVGAVSPPGGDYSEPVTQTSQRVSGAVWALDAALAYRRHYPSVNWNRSYSLYFDALKPWFEQHGPANWITLRQEAMTLLQRDAEMQEVVQLVGPDALQDAERLVLEIARMLREMFLQQNAFSKSDMFCGLEKMGGLLDILLNFHEACRETLKREVPLSRVLDLPIREEISRLRDMSNEEFPAKKADVQERMKQALAGLQAH
ncbi:MAG TPA: V-type ATP synthase subunit A [Candidatus Hydrogenedentes bacterium]|nr:V-type ATP synthase subunit A [Candidatus Hydrogenedentota bacterium]HNT87546.1 V-type ATP synthase subunit A [Candidatus Hydrogenedentota bacterium]